MNRSCVECVFCVKYFRLEGAEGTFTLLADERAATPFGSNLKSHYSLKCHRGQWDENVPGGDQIHRDRTSLLARCCADFIPPDSSPSGKVLEAYEDDLLRRRQAVQFWWTVAGTVSAVVAAVASIIALFRGNG